MRMYQITIISKKSVKNTAYSNEKYANSFNIINQS